MGERRAGEKREKQQAVRVTLVSIMAIIKFIIVATYVVSIMLPLQLSL